MDQVMLIRRTPILVATSLLLLFGTESVPPEDRISSSERSTFCKPFATDKFPTSCLQFVAHVVCTDVLMQIAVDFKKETLLPNGLEPLAEDIVIQDTTVYFNFENETLLELNGLVSLADNFAIRDLRVPVPQNNRKATILENNGLPFHFDLYGLLGTLGLVWYMFDFMWMYVYLDYYTGWLQKGRLVAMRIFVTYKMLLILGIAVCYFMNH